ncbi:NAD+ synthase [Methanimicrococcus sp. OttesenSCG-928-J09]|nr:NAD+ synthase [Methanimicrococcus sp. OttesenSCG-928-J09]
MTSSDPLFNSVPKPFQNFNPAAAEKIIIDFIQKTVKESGSTGVVLGLSGGIDSALVAALSVKALGVENVHPVFFYTDNLNADEFDSEDLQDAVLLCSNLGLTLQKINMFSLFSAAQSSFDTNSNGSNESVSVSFSDMKPDDLISFGNLKSRLRMSLLYYYANRNHLLVIGTKNKTERLTGYYTKYGDGGVDLDPIADLYKTEVRLLSKYMELPESILKKVPSAGFWSGQSDEDDLGISYEQLDVLLYELNTYQNNFSFLESTNLEVILKKTGLTKNEYESILSRIRGAEHKQRLPDFPKTS